MKPNEYEPGTGYFKQNWGALEVKNSWSNIKVGDPNPNIVWGAAYWQYFEDLDKDQRFPKAHLPLTIVSSTFQRGKLTHQAVLKPVAEGQTFLKRGDKIKVRIEIRVDRAMEAARPPERRHAGGGLRSDPTYSTATAGRTASATTESTKGFGDALFIDYCRAAHSSSVSLFVSHKGDMSNSVHGYAVHVRTGVHEPSRRGSEGGVVFFVML
ncbi:MAG: hypothetical protein KIS77_02165 [Saprospiraceae bacterium]|nr:hypothetical protein [Saprospiraceae bacterium]